MVGVGAVVFTADDRVVLVRRARPPLAGEWTLPGGLLELGERVKDGVVREVREETGLTVDVGPVADVFEHIATDPAGRIEYHYVVVDYLCRVLGGSLCAGSDAADVAAVPLSDLSAHDIIESTQSVIRRAERLRGRPDVT